MQIFRLCLLARKVTKFLMPFFKLQVGFLLDFALPSSVMTYNPSEISSWKCILWTKRAHQCTIFQNFERCNESSPNSSCHFWNHKVRIYSNFESLFSAMKDNSSAFFLPQTLYTLDKNSPSKWNFQTFDWLSENSQNPSCHIWNYKSVFL